MAKRALGRGIDALLGGKDTPPSESAAQAGAPAVAAAAAGGATTIPLADLIANDQQPRRNFDAAALEELSDSIRQFGVLQPVLVERVAGGYRIIAGERRCRAARLAGFTEVPALVRDTTSRERLEIALIENVQREDLTPIEEAQAYSQLLEAGSLSQEELARRVGKRRSTVANSLRLLKLAPAVQSAVGKGDLSAGHARALLMVDNPDQRQELFRRAVQEGLSVRQVEEAAASRPRRRSAAAPPNQSDPELAALEQQLIDSLGTKVAIRGTSKQGRIEIGYFSLEELNRLLEKLR